LGYTGDDLNNFQLTLTNPSLQAEQMKSELMRDKAQTYTELTRGEGGIAAMSHTNAKRKLWNMSDKEIVEDLKQQKMEKVIMQELQDSPVNIKKTGLFADIDAKYGEPVEGMPVGGESGATTPGGELPGGGGAPVPAGGMPPAPGGAPAGGAPEMGGGMPPEAAAPPAGGAPPLAEGKLGVDTYNKLVEKLVMGDTSEPERKKSAKHKKVINENNAIVEKLNNKALEMVSEIDSLINNSESINTQHTALEGGDDVDFETIENLDLDDK
jgi:hypothetical protein